MRWSYSDLLALRLIDWLRRDKPSVRIPKTSMAKIRNALVAVEDLGDRLRDREVRVWVDQRGGIVLRAEDETFVPLPRGLIQTVADLGEVDLVQAFNKEAGIRAPNLSRPRPTLRIIPGKLSSEPHVEDTRIPTSMLAALARRGFDQDVIRELYPTLSAQNVNEAIDLEVQLEHNLHLAA